MRAPEIERFLAVASFAVVGASADRAKYGNKVLRCYLQHGLPAFPIHPRLREVEGQPCYASLRDLSAPAPAVSVIVPPSAAMAVVEDALAAGVQHLWFQPGAEDAAAIERARAAGLSVIANGPCVLVALGFRDV